MGRSFVFLAILILSAVSHPRHTSARDLQPQIRSLASPDQILIPAPSGHHSSGGHHEPGIGHHAGQPCFTHHPPTKHHNHSGKGLGSLWCGQQPDVFTYKLPPPAPQLVDGCCDGKGTGLFADVYSNPPCSRFCDCINGIQRSGSQCYTGLLFNESLGVSSCDDASQVSCGGVAPAPAPIPHLVCIPSTPPGHMGAWAHGHSSPRSSLSRFQAHNGVLHTGFFDHNAITCPPGTCTPLKYRKLNRLFRYASALPLPSVDWVAEGKVAPPRYQHGCNGCWAFSAVSAIESAVAINDESGPVELSVQQVLDCLAAAGDTCEGGDPDDVLEYVARQGALTLAHLYPLAPSQVAAGVCDRALEEDAALHPRSTRISAWERVPPNDPRSLCKAVSSQPVLVALSSQLPAFYEYSGGILDDPNGDCPPQPDHNLLIVGYGSEDGKDFWLAQNSWGVSWGEGGYIRIARYAQGAGFCGMLTIAPSYPVVDPFTLFSHKGSRWPQAQPPQSLRPLPTTGPKGHHPPGIGKHYPLGGHFFGEGHHPPGVGNHPAPKGHHKATQLVPQAATACGGGMMGSPCGGGQCVVGAVVSEYTCVCPHGYVSVANSADGRESCAEEDVCLASSSNPCGVGECRNNGQGGYSCACPQGFRTAQRSVDGTPTCAPAEASAFNLVANTWQVPAGGQSCRDIEGAAGVDHLQFLYLNPGVNCTQMLSEGSVVAVGPVAHNVSCGVTYTTTANETCGSVMQLFGGVKGDDLSLLNPTLSIACNGSDHPLPPHVPLCVAPGTSALVQPCGVFYTIPEFGETSCASLAENTTSYEFFALNPGIACDRLVGGQEVCVLPYVVGASPCRPSHCPYRNAGAFGEYLYTVKPGDSCISLAQDRFHCKSSMVSCLNYGISCASNRLLVGQVLCAPSWNPGNQRCQQKVHF